MAIRNEDEARKILLNAFEREEWEQMSDEKRSEVITELADANVDRDHLVLLKWVLNCPDAFDYCNEAMEALESWGLRNKGFGELLRLAQYYFNADLLSNALAELRNGTKH